MPEILPETTLAPAHQFEDLEQERDASLAGMWVFLMTEILFFGGLFACYSVYRLMYPRAIAEGSRHLNLLIGGINTAVLIASSFTMALAVEATEEGRRRSLTAFLLITMLLGSVFLSLKAVEYAHKFKEGLVPGRMFLLQRHPAEEAGGLSTPAAGRPAPGFELFFAFYFVMTGMHALHMVIGIAILGILTFKAWRGRFTPGRHAAVEITGLYWHFVDIVWIFLFPLLYLLGVH